MRGFIDPPGPFSPKKAWRDFLASLSRLPADDPDVKREREAAEKMLAEAKD
jgi:hypothetical protein